MNLFPERLLSLRKSRNLSQSSLAHELGVTERTIRRYEKGDFEPSMSELIALADYFGVTLDELVGRSDINANRT